MTADDSVVSLENMCGCLLSKARTRDTSSAQPRNTSGKADPAAPPQPTGAAPAARRFFNFIYRGIPNKYPPSINDQDQIHTLKISLINDRSKFGARSAKILGIYVFMWDFPYKKLGLLP